MSARPDPDLRCAGCGAAPSVSEPYPFRCPNAGRGDVDHVLHRVPRGDAALLGEPSENPFVRWRHRLFAWERGRAGGLGDDALVDLIEALDEAVGRVDGRRFRITPLLGDDALARRLGVGAVCVKDETGNVSGSHKARHLMGILLYLSVRRALGAPEAPERPLAIASCGNAALAAAVLARAADRPLEVYVPTSADGRVLARLAHLGAKVIPCPRVPGEAGDPAYLRFREAVARGALPFSCQGPDNGLTIEGGQTLAWELAESLWARGEGLDRLFVQVGGGALASACVLGLEDAYASGMLPELPRVHAVQTGGAAPLGRAYERVAGRIDAALGGGGGGPAERAERIRRSYPAAAVREALAHAAHHRSEYMWPWESEPHSLAHGILDDETYDWLTVVRGMLRTGGHPVVVDEAQIREANALGREHAGVQVDFTGTSGLAGALALSAAGGLPGEERIAVLFTGVDRATEVVPD